MSVSIPHFGLTRQYTTLRSELLDATDSVLKTGNLVNSEQTKKLENWLQSKTNTKYAIAVHSGTQALEIIARYIGYFQVPEIISGLPKVRLPNFTYPATVNAFMNAGYEIELGDTDRYGILTNENPDPVVLKCLVGLYGRKPVNWGTTAVIVDGAQHWLVAGSQIGFGMSISFDPTKNLNASGNGGAIVTNNEGLYHYAIDWRDNGKPNGYNNGGSNSKMSEIDCSHVLVRSKYIDEWQARRKKISNYWCERFRKLPVECLSDTDVPHAHQKFVLYLPQRNALHAYCLLSGIETKIHYEYVLGELPMTQSHTKPDILSVSHLLSRGVISLPLYPELTDSEVELIASVIEGFFES